MAWAMAGPSEPFSWPTQTSGTASGGKAPGTAFKAAGSEAPWLSI